LIGQGPASQSLRDFRPIARAGHSACFSLRLGLNAWHASESLQNRVGSFLSKQNYRQDLLLRGSNQKGIIMNEVAQNMAWAVVFSALGGLIGSGECG